MNSSSGAHLAARISLSWIWIRSCEGSSCGYWGRRDGPSQTLPGLVFHNRLVKLLPVGTTDSLKARRDTRSGVFARGGGGGGCGVASHAPAAAQ